MSLDYRQKLQLDELISYRDQIVNNLYHIERILKQYFPEEFNIAYQHWIPQITTALYEEKKWLNRGEQTMQHTINRIVDKDSSQIGQNTQKIF